MLNSDLQIINFERGMKKTFFTSVALLLFAISIQAQIVNPVSWSFDQKKISETEYELHFNAGSGIFQIEVFPAGTFEILQTNRMFACL